MVRTALGTDAICAMESRQDTHLMVGIFGRKLKPETQKAYEAIFDGVKERTLNYEISHYATWYPTDSGNLLVQGIDNALSFGLASRVREHYAEKSHENLQARKTAAIWNAQIMAADLLRKACREPVTLSKVLLLEVRANNNHIWKGEPFYLEWKRPDGLSKAVGQWQWDDYLVNDSPRYYALNTEIRMDGPRSYRSLGTVQMLCDGPRYPCRVSYDDDKGWQIK